MDSWSYDCEGKGLLFTDEWGLKPSNDFEAVEQGMEFMDFGFADMKKKPFFGNTNLGTFGDEFGNNNSAKRLVSSDCNVTTSSYHGEEQFGTSKHSTSLMESNSPESSSLIDFCRDSKGCKFLKGTSIDSPVSMSKKAPTTSSYSHAHHCQVYGCNTDLSSSKDYYKRNKVCEAHSKTAKVIVNGTEMRFCQQCSRFHLLAEFDDRKRSCRKRLVGHNERRRKFHFGTLSRKSHKLLQSYQGTKLMRTSVPKATPFVTSNALEGDFVIYQERYEHANRVKSEEKPVYSGQLLPKYFFHMNGNEKQWHFNAPDAASTVKELSGVSHSDCALSLLSAQSRDLSSHATGIRMAKPFINQACHPLCCLGKDNVFYSCGMNPMGVGQAGPAVVSDAVNIEVVPDGYFRGSGVSSHC
ncbi:hypothetical protein HRI_004483700 [Hibiscus trionum]|uniref:SBP-type domain-containing protein n=1 Tax=Hibiscus trionum TaxID=183268 RepID=A0A9W7J6A1_HIBTR|nr:hypothetical protein HRI_004483700 [Hibiscus trionum]